MKDMEIVGGMSLPNEIRLFTPNSSIYARFEKKTGGIRSHFQIVRGQSSTKKSRWWLPQLVQTLHGFWRMSGWLGKLLILLWVYWVTPNPWRPVYNYYFGLNDLSFMLGMILIEGTLLLFLINRFVGTWHAAEHMAISAWEKHKSYDLYTIAIQPRVHEQCGGRFLVPILVGIVVTPFLLQEISLALRPWSLLITLELALQVDRHIGLCRIPGLKQVSIWLQRYATTRPPSLNEISTAQTALIGLLLADEVITIAEAKQACPELQVSLGKSD